MDWVFAFIVGFIAQFVDVYAGMGYGVLSNTLFLFAGIPPHVSSSTIHQSEILATLFSGLSHHRAGNVDKRLFVRLAVTGCVGGGVGAFVLSYLSLHAYTLVLPVSLYLLVVGVVVVARATGILKQRFNVDTRVLGFVGGFLDAVGGGGWGPVVTGTLVSSGEDPAKSVGSANASEFFVTLVESAVFTAMVGANLKLLVPFLAGTLVASPVAARACKKSSPRKLQAVVGVLLLAVNTATLLRILVK